MLPIVREGSFSVGDLWLWFHGLQVEVEVGSKKSKHLRGDIPDVETDLQFGKTLMLNGSPRPTDTMAVIDQQNPLSGTPQVKGFNEV